MYGRFSIWGPMNIILGNIVANTDLKTIWRIKIQFIFESQCWLFEIN